MTEAWEHITGASGHMTGAYEAQLQGFRFRGHQMELRVHVPGCREDQVKAGLLVLDSAQETAEIPMELTCAGGPAGAELTLSLTCDDATPLRPVRWFCCLDILDGEDLVRCRIRCSKPALLRRMRMRNVQCEHRDNMILVPYVGGGHAFKLTWRERNEYDTAAVRRRELLAEVLYRLAGPILRRQGKYIVYEKFCRMAQDNGYYFFRYCMQKLDRKEAGRFYYVIDKRSPDYRKLREYDAQVIQFMSLRHMLYARAARLCISTDSAEHLYVWQPRPGYMASRIGHKRVLFLQHGVLALKRVEHLYGKQGFHPVTYFAVSSAYEQDLVEKDFGYDRRDVPITGLCRWDVLENREDPEDRFLLIMPTWRIWLEDVSDEEFAASDYYRQYLQLLEDPRLLSLLEEKDMTAVFYLHSKFAGYLENFRRELSGRIRLIPFGQEPLNELIMRCAMLVTDYSSVCWDSLYLDKPVLFYQFDCDRYLKAHGSYLDQRTELPGPRAETGEALIGQIEAYAERDFQIPEEYRRRIGHHFAYKDRKNCQRTYEYLVEMEGN